MQTFLASAANLRPTRRAGPSARASYDAVLLGRIATGDRTAMHVLFSNHQVQVYRFVLRRLGNKALAEDVASEVFLEVWRHADRFEGRSTVSSWILAIARHKAYSARPRAGHMHLDDEMAEELEDVTDAPDVAVHANERANVVRKCLAMLSVEHREILDLVYYQEQSVAAVASILGIPNNTAKTRVFYARKKLWAELKKLGVDFSWI
jgi:RNA polymerase sigma-70 factor, ECF subfamily